MSESVVLIPGIWMPRAEMMPFRRRLAVEYGLSSQCFGYRSVRGNLEENARRLAECISAAGTDQVHLVGHSLGGVLALHTLSIEKGLPPGRVVCLGSPLCGSRAAAVLNRRTWTRGVLGKTITACVVERPASDWAGTVVAERQVGVVAGTKAQGFGRLFCRFDEQSDGTVTVSETRLGGVADHVLMPVSHTLMVFSAAVARETVAFLRDGHFSRAGPS